MTDEQIISRAKVVIAYKPWRQIKYLTYNLKTEIGAVGVGEIKTDEEGEKYFYLEKLFFPNQKVSGATVHIQPEGWAKILREMTKKEREKVCFYWHRHPGSSHHSSTDQEDTFDTFMSKEAGRPWFVFLQTAGDNEKQFNYELRIEVRDPVRATLLGQKYTELIYEVSEEEIQIEEEIAKLQEKLEKLKNDSYDSEKEEMDKVVKECIIEEPKTYLNYFSSGHNYSKSSYNADSNKTPPPILSDIEALKLLFEKTDRKEYMNNETVMDMPTAEEESASLEISDGCIKFGAGILFKKFLDRIMVKDSMYMSAVKRVTEKEGNKLKMIIVQPAPKMYEKLVDMSKKVFVAYNTALVEKFKRTEEETLEVKVTEDFNDSFKKPSEIAEESPEYDGLMASELLAGSTIPTDAPTTMTYTDKELIVELLFELESAAEVEWKDDSYARVFSGPDKKKDYMGSFVYDKKKNSVIFTGKELVFVIQNLEYIINYETEFVDANEEVIENGQSAKPVKTE